MESNNDEEQSGLGQQSGIPSFDTYVSMSEQEKDAAIEQSVVRLQNNILQIMYLMELESKSSGKPLHPAQPNDHPRLK